MDRHSKIFLSNFEKINFGCDKPGGRPLSPNTANEIIRKGKQSEICMRHRKKDGAVVAYRKNTKSTPKKSSKKKQPVGEKRKNKNETSEVTKDLQAEFLQGIVEIHEKMDGSKDVYKKMIPEVKKMKKHLLNGKKLIDF